MHQLFYPQCRGLGTTTANEEPTLDPGVWEPRTCGEKRVGNDAGAVSKEGKRPRPQGEAPSRSAMKLRQQAKAKP